jgi:hypothetical protein
MRKKMRGGDRFALQRTAAIDPVRISVIWKCDMGSALSGPEFPQNITKRKTQKG